MDINNRIQSIKNKLEKMINNLQIEDAKQYLSQFKDILPNEKDIITYEIVIAILEGNIDFAEKLAMEILNEDPFHKDVLFNLGYIKELKGEFQEAYDLYIDCRVISEETNKELDIALDRIKDKVNITNETKRLTFFCKKGMDSFLGEIINDLSSDYRIKKIVVEDLEQINIGMSWADVCWFEWCDELIIYGSKLLDSKNKKIICRIHSYEIFTQYIYEVNWSNVDHVIFVNENISKVFLEKIFIPSSNISIIPNGIDTEKFSYLNRKKGFDVAYVGYINYKKGPMFLIQIINELCKVDKRYKLHIAGTIQDERYFLYFRQMIEELNLQNNIIFYPWQENINTWLEDKQYIISTSLLESQHLSIMEGMAKGLKPIIHNFVGARSIYPQKYIWNEFSEAITLITEDTFNSSEYNNFIEENFSLDKQIIYIRDLLDTLINNSPEKQLSFLYESKEIKFILPHQKDHISTILLFGRSFYELEMLLDIKNKIKKDSLVLDVGANIGNHSVFLGRICEADVHSFEPNPVTFKYLKENIRINNCTNVVVHNIGLGEKQDTAIIKESNLTNLGMASLEKTTNGDIVINSIDNLFSNQEIAVIKVDVEGMELDVLKGAKNTLEKTSPILYVETRTEKEFKEIENYVSQYGYKAKQSFNHTPTILFEKVN